MAILDYHTDHLAFIFGQQEEQELKEPADEGELRLDQFLKLSGIAATGGHAKILIQGGDVTLNGEIETRRRRKLKRGDVIEVDGQLVSPDEFFLNE